MDLAWLIKPNQTKQRVDQGVRGDGFKKKFLKKKEYSKDRQTDRQTEKCNSKQ